MEHPLQNINLSDHDDVDNHNDHPIERKDDSSSSSYIMKNMLVKNNEAEVNSKKNWVKFDEDNDHDDNHNDHNVNANEGSFSGENELTVINNNNNNNNDENATTNRLESRSPILATSRLQSPSTATAPITSKRYPPAGANATEEFIHSQQRAANLNGNSNQLNQQSTTAPPTLPKATTVSKLTDTAPAVLATESIHVNLNASGKTQQQNPITTATPTTNPTNKSSSANRLSPHSSSHNVNSNNRNSNTNNNNNNTNNPHIQLNYHGIEKATMSPVINVEMQRQSPQTQSSQTQLQLSSPSPSTLQMRTIELSTGRVREGFANGDVIVTLLPANTKWPWITPAVFRPELVPEELMAQGLTLTVEEYVHAMETLVNDYRFTLYNICYKRILICWIFFAFAVLLTLLFSGLQGVPLFSLGVGWLFLNAAAIFFCMWIKLRLSRGLEKCLARVNKQLIKHKIILILDDRGRISCHKVNLCFLYFDSAPCINFLNEFLEQTEQNGGERIKAGWEAKLDIDINDIVIQGTNPVRLSRKQERGIKLFLRYASRWGMEAVRGLLDVTCLEPGRHCRQFQCPCQYIKDHIQCKPRDYPCNCIVYASDPHFQYHY